MNNLDHESETLLSILDKPFKEAIKNLFTTLYIWQNQFLLWAISFFLYGKSFFDSIFIGLIICMLLNFLSCIYWAYYGFKEAIRIDRTSE